MAMQTFPIATCATRELVERHALLKYGNLSSGTVDRELVPDQITVLNLYKRFLRPLMCKPHENSCLNMRLGVRQQYVGTILYYVPQGKNAVPRGKKPA